MLVPELTKRVVWWCHLSIQITLRFHPFALELTKETLSETQRLALERWVLLGRGKIPKKPQTGSRSRRTGRWELGAGREEVDNRKTSDHFDFGFNIFRQFFSMCFSIFHHLELESFLALLAGPVFRAYAATAMLDGSATTRGSRVGPSGFPRGCPQSSQWCSSNWSC